MAGDPAWPDLPLKRRPARLQGRAGQAIEDRDELAAGHQHPGALGRVKTEAPDQQLELGSQRVAVVVALAELLQNARHALACGGAAVLIASSSASVAAS